MGNYIQLNRSFSPISTSKDSEYQEDWSSFLGSTKHLQWGDILKEFRCVILAEAGAGKTEELKQQALYLKAQDFPSFFIRIEDIDRDFEDAFEVGSQGQFQQWLDNYDEAWFFLDSVDEARLTSPGAFKKAIDKFSKRITDAKHRAHIFVSSRPYAWRPSEDRKLMDDKLYLPEIAERAKYQAEGDKEADNSNSSLKVLTIRPLDKEKINLYCLTRDVENVNELLNEISRLSLWSLAERPFDLESIIDKWKEDKALGSRIELLKHNIKVKLTDQHSTDRAATQTLTLEKAQHGARRLAASVVLTAYAGILIPGAITNTKGIRANEVLSDWSPADVRSLLELGIFNDIVYNTVRFRHREIRELLAAEWFDSLLKSGSDSNSIKALFFQEQYGEQIITPRLRSVLSWLILFDDDFYQQAISIAPEIAVEGGDPAIFSLPQREQLLDDIVQKIISDEYNHGARDNTAIARIAAPDLTPKAIELIKKYVDNDDAIFFLGRLAWQGKMIDSIHLFENIVLNVQRGIYARIAAMRAIVTLGDPHYRIWVWKCLNNKKGYFSLQLLSELLDELPSDFENAQYLLASIAKLELVKRGYYLSSIRHSLTEFIRKLSVQSNLEIVTYLLDGFVRLLNQEPFENKPYYKVSKKHSWLASNIAQILEKIIEARCELAMSPNALSFMLSQPKVKSCKRSEFDDYKDNLQNLIPRWPELNYALYWASVKQARSMKEAKDERLVDDWEVYYHGNFWLIDEVSYKGLLNSIPTIEFEDDQLVAVSTVIRFYQQTGKPSQVLDDLKAAVEGNKRLQGSLQASLGPRIRAISENEKQHDAIQKELDAEQQQDVKKRLKWIVSLRANPERINNVLGLKPSELTDDLWRLYSEIEGDDLNQSRVRGAQWQKLVPEFSEAVAKEYKVAVKHFWRHFDTELQSELNEYNNTVPSPLFVAMAGLEIEFREVPTFPHHLSTDELKHALRYLAKELNGLPKWLESLYKTFPKETLEAVKTELIWELEHTKPDKHLHYVLHNLLFYAPWIHEELAPIVFDWLISYPEKILEYPEYCIKIILGGNLNLECLIDLIKREISRYQPITNKAHWFALWVDCCAEDAIPAIEDSLSKMTVGDAKNSAELFVTALVGDRRGNGAMNYYETYVTPRYLKELYILVHKYVSSEDDINRVDGGSYSPELRDDAQSARSRLFSLLSDLPGKATYIAMKELELEHPEPNYRPWMTKQAFKRAESDGDIEPWNSDQVFQFEHQQLITPKTHKQLYELGVLKLNNMKVWLEHGNDSSWKTWQRAPQENEMRNLIAVWLNQNCQNQYTTAQEPELANDQRMDIWLQSNHVNTPVPIEIKLLDKSWSGNHLCERLRNQLVGDYLRANGASCGIMVLVSAQTTKKWKIDGQPVDLNQLGETLMKYWKSIANDHPKVNAIEVIVIDLNLRSKVSDT